MARVNVPVWPVRDELDEEDETFRLRMQQHPNQPWTVIFVPADPEAPPCGRSCKSTVTIVDDDTRGVTLGEMGTLAGLAESAGTDPAIQSAAPAKRTPGRT